jgi:hypothetical protein
MKNIEGKNGTWCQGRKNMKNMKSMMNIEGKKNVKNIEEVIGDPVEVAAGDLLTTGVPSKMPSQRAKYSNYTSKLATERKGASGFSERQGRSLQDTDNIKYHNANYHNCNSYSGDASALPSTARAPALEVHLSFVLPI